MSAGQAGQVNTSAHDARNPNDVGGSVTGPAWVVAYCIDPIAKGRATLVRLDKSDTQSTNGSSTDALGILKSVLAALPNGVLPPSTLGVLGAGGHFSLTLPANSNPTATPSPRKRLDDASELVRRDAATIADAEEKIHRAFETNALVDPVSVSIAAARAGLDLHYVRAPAEATAVALPTPDSRGCSHQEPAVAPLIGSADLVGPGDAQKDGYDYANVVNVVSATDATDAKLAADLETFKTAYHALLESAQVMVNATKPATYQRQTLVDCHGMSGAESRATAVSLKNPAAASPSPTPSPTASATGGNKAALENADGKKPKESPTPKASPDADELVTVNCYARLTGSSGASYTTVPVNAFGLAPTPGPTVAASAERRFVAFPRMGTPPHVASLPALFSASRLSLAAGKKMVVKTQAQSGQSQINLAAMHYRMFTLGGPDGPDVDFTFAAPSKNGQGLLGLSLAVARSLYLTAGIQQTSFQDLASGLALGRLVPAGTPVTTKNVLTTKFAFGLSFASPLSNGGTAKSSPRKSTSTDSNQSK